MASFQHAQNCIGNKFPTISYLFFVKDPKRYLPVRPDTFSDRFQSVGIDGWKKSCNWDNYKDFISAIEEIQFFLMEYFHDESISLLDAHSFVWMAWMDKFSEEEYFVEIEKHYRIYVPPLYICSQINSQESVRPLIASIGIPTEIKNRMIFDSLLFNKFARLYYMFNNNSFKEEFDFQLNKSSFKEFETIEDLKKYIKEEEYIDKKNDICFGLSFSHDNETNNYNYSLHFFDFDKVGNEGIRDISTTSRGLFENTK